MVKPKDRSSDVEFVLEEEDDIIDDEEEVEVQAPARKEGVKTGGVERYEVRIGPPVVSGRKVKPLRTPEEKTEKPRELSGPPAQAAPSMFQQQGISQSSITVAGAQQIYKIEDDLRRTRDIVEDLRHNMGTMEGEVKDLRAEMERISYLLRSLEGLKNTMKDMESTVSELSGLYDLISANINPFVEIPPLESRDKLIKPQTRLSTGGEEIEEDGFQDISDMFEEEEETECEDEDPFDAHLESAEWALRWTKFLIERVGKEGLERTLDYYMDLGWIDEDTIDRVLEIARGTVGPKLPSASDGRKVTWRMDAEDHVKSLEYIRRIRSNRR
ncbi:MAG: FlaD/FlaE family flagellar protein [Thermoplasmatota archaeon]